MSLRIQTTPDLTKLEGARVWPNGPFPKAIAEAEPGLASEKRDGKTGESKEKESVPKGELGQWDMESAVESINGAMEHVNRGLRFAIHEDTQRVIVKVINVVTQEVIKEIPPEDVLDTAARIREMIGVLLDEKA